MKGSLPSTFFLKQNLRKKRPKSLCFATLTLNSAFTDLETGRNRSGVTFCYRKWYNMSHKCQNWAKNGRFRLKIGHFQKHLLRLWLLAMASFWS